MKATCRKYTEKCHECGCMFKPEDINYHIKYLCRIAPEEKLKILKEYRIFK
jgi:hypothetical protein